MKWTMINQINEMDYDRWNECDGLWQIKWMCWTMVDEMDEMDYGRSNECDGLC